MINCLSIKCSLAFAPYILESTEEFIDREVSAGRLVRQGGFGMTFRSDGGLIVHHQNREARLRQAEAVHYQATIDFRRRCFEILRMADEVVMSTVGNQLLISHPQSELWLDSTAVATLITAYGGEASLTPIAGIAYSVGGGRLMLSDQHNGRWVLLGSDHTEEMKRRLKDLPQDQATDPVSHPPTINLKGVELHLQSAFRLVEVLRGFSANGELEPFTETTPTYLLAVNRSSEGIELRDSSNRVAITKREAVKWADIIAAELETLSAKQFERGNIRTVTLAVGERKWVLQWGDEVSMPMTWFRAAVESGARLEQNSVLTSDPGLRIGRSGNFTLVLNTVNGACVGLTEDEMEFLV